MNGMLERLGGCRASPSCVATARANASSLRRPGAVKILSLKSTTAYSLTGATGKTRLAWTVIGQAAGRCSAWRCAAPEAS